MTEFEAKALDSSPPVTAESENSSVWDWREWRQHVIL
jgi:hypothetical protein